MYLIYCAVAFAVIAYWSSANRFEWSILAALSIILWCNKSFFLNTDQTLYYVRAVLAFISARLLIYDLSKFGFYQAFIQLLILVAYGCLAYDVANNEHILIYNNYGAVIHGLVACQFLAIFPEIRDRVNHSNSSDFNRGNNNQGIQKA
jgi:hypothetical protein